MGKIRLNATKFFDELGVEQDHLLKTQYREFVRKLVELLLTSAVYYTPVRKGLLRGSWRIAVGRADLSSEPTIDAAGPSTIAAGMAKLGARFNPYSQIYISNVAKYASWVENGTDRMAGHFMLERAKLDVERIA